MTCAAVIYEGGPRCALEDGHADVHSVPPNLQWRQQLCWALGPLGPQLGVDRRCILDLGHDGPHGWERRETEAGMAERVEFAGYTYDAAAWRWFWSGCGDDMTAGEWRRLLDRRPVPPPDPAADHRRPRLRSCVEAWPQCAEGEYDPRCCRFPKSCSCTVYDEQHVTAADLVQPYRQEARRG